jgi:hypothetical protein
MIWFDEEIILNKNISEQLSQVASIIQLGIIIPSALLCSGVLLSAISISFALNEKYKKVKIKKREYKNKICAN